MHCAATLLLGALPFVVFPTLADSNARAQGRVKWRYRVQASYIAVRPAVAKDGTIYAVDITGTLHAIAPNGTGKWTLPSAGRNGVDVADDGTVYTADTTRILAVRPSGSVKWSYSISPVAHCMLGPSVGPDGNIYANAASGPGMLSLTPAGKLRWVTATRAGRPSVQDQELVFRPASGNRGLQVFYSGHGELAQVDASNGKLTVISTGGDNQPVIGSNGDVYPTASYELRAFKPDGNLRWSIRSRIGMTDPTVASNGVVYVVRDSYKLHALRPNDGTSLWEHSDLSTMRMPMASPSNRMILVSGRSRGSADFVRAVDPSGKLMWQVDLRHYGVVGPFPMTPARFTKDGNTAYIGTSVDNIHCYLYAFDTSPKHIAEVWTWGRACRGVSTKLPILSFGGRPVLGSTFSVDLSEARASSTAVHIVGFSTTRISFQWQGAPDCTAYVVPSMTSALQTDSQGQVKSPLTVPNDAALAGLKLFHQFAVADPVNRLGLVATTGGGSVLGF